MTIDKELVAEFLILEHSEISEEHVKEVERVIEIVLNKYHPADFAEYEELKHQVLLKIFENKVNYSPKYDAYNYIFTIARNESGNLLKRLKRETLTDEFWSEGECDDEHEEFESPVLQKYAKFLTGEVDWNFVRIRQDEVAEILLFFHKFKKKDIPSYLNSEGVAERLYYILNKLILDNG